MYSQYNNNVIKSEKKMRRTWEFHKQTFFKLICLNNIFGFGIKENMRICSTTQKENGLGIEPRSSHMQAHILPLSYIPVPRNFNMRECH
jgi:hypothetical protein